MHGMMGRVIPRDDRKGVNARDDGKGQGMIGRASCADEAYSVGRAAVAEAAARRESARHTRRPE